MIEAIVFDAYGTLYDVQSVADVVETAFPGQGEYITQLWRLKQLEYSWLRSMSGTYADFWTVTCESLVYTLATLGQVPDDALLADIAEAYNNLRPYSDAENCLKGLSDYKRAIFSNGSPDMLARLVENSSLAPHLDSQISVDSKQVFKPDPRSYQLIGETIGLPPDRVLFVSSNGFDICGAKLAGFTVARIERVSAATLSREIMASHPIGPKTFFKAQRLQLETWGPGPDITVGALSQLPSQLPSLVPSQSDASR
jgi:2-haloacid dehalogenase